MSLLGCLVFRCLHVYGDPVHTEPTCLSPGADYRICSLCGKVITAQSYPALDHVFGEWIVETEPDLVSDGVETAICERCGAVQTRAIPCLAEQFTDTLPRLEIIANATGVGVDSAVPCEFRCTSGNESVSGLLMLRYLPPEERTPHDYASIVASSDRDASQASPQLIVFSKDNELYMRADHEDPLHIRAEALAGLFLETAGVVGERYASLLTLPDGTGYFGTQIALYQNNTYLEPRFLALSPAAFCASHPAITCAVYYDGGKAEEILGSGAEVLTAAFDAAASGIFDAFDTDALAAYLVFRDAVRLNGALADKLLFVCDDSGRWYPLPVILENALGIGGVNEGLCAADAAPLDTPSAVLDTFWSAVRTDLAPQLDTMRATLHSGVLSADAVSAKLRETADAFPADFAEQSRGAETEALKARGGSIQNIIDWYRLRTESESR